MTSHWRSIAGRKTDWINFCTFTRGKEIKTVPRTKMFNAQNKKQIYIKNKFPKRTFLVSRNCVTENGKNTRCDVGCGARVNVRYRTVYESARRNSDIRTLVAMHQVTIMPPAPQYHIVRTPGLHRTAVPPFRSVQHRQELSHTPGISARRVPIHHTGFARSRPPAGDATGQRARRESV